MHGQFVEIGVQEGNDSFWEGVGTVEVHGERWLLIWERKEEGERFRIGDLYIR